MNNSRAPLIVGVVVALALMVGLNVMQQSNDPKAQEQLKLLKEKQEAIEEAKKAAIAPTPVDPSAAKNANKLAERGAVVKVGSASAETEIVLGWEWTPEVQADPSKVYNAIEAVESLVEKSGGRLRARIVNIDTDPTVVPGISIGGMTQVSASADGSIESQNLMRVVGSAMQKK